ncbi:histidine kinase [Nonomuraea sp. NPDC050310]|uniref:sensor histidine kinase n=1 Tax=Nonomuraea sp. NPDC050310 TaxID=3154935 RepID=UPI0033EADA79
MGNTRLSWQASVAIAIATLAVMLEVADIWITAQLPPVPGNPLPFQPEDMAGTTFPVFGAILVHSRPRLPIGWLLCSGGLASAVNIVCGNLDKLYGPHPLRWPLALLAWQVYALAVGVLLPLLYPTGRLPSRPWLAVIVVSALLAVADWISWIWYAPALPQLGEVYLAVMAAAVSSLALRLRGAGPVERRQILWLLLALPFALVPYLAGWPAWWLASLTLPLLPAAMWVAIQRHRLFGIDTLISRALVGTGLAVVIAGAYLAAGAASSLFLADVDQLAGLAAALGAGVFLQPIRRLMQRGVDRLLYGSTGDPATLAEESKRRLQQADPAQGLLSVLEVLREGLAVTGAAVDVDGVRTVSGEVPHTARAVALTWHGEPVGTLLLGPPGKRRFPAAHDERVLATLVPFIADATHAVRLTADLQRSRERILSAREEERRRLRRDLHDGLGQSLSGMAMSLNAARITMRHSPDQAERLLARLREGMDEVSGDIRRLVYGLRPPALDELGLAGAIADLLDEPPPGLAEQAELGELPAAVEVAAYRIAQEAITNARKHSGATRIVATLEREGGMLRITVQDDGCGLPRHLRAGIGLGSMRERAAELGGACTVRPAQGGGTLVSAVLPV